MNKAKEAFAVKKEFNTGCIGRLRRFAQRGSRGWSDEDAADMRGWPLRVLPEMPRYIRDNIPSAQKGMAGICKAECGKSDCDVCWRETLNDMIGAFECAACGDERLLHSAVEMLEMWVLR